MLQAHYRSILDFSDDAIVAAEKGYKRLMEAMHSLKDISASAKALLIFLLGNKCYDAMNDDFNTPILIAQLFEGVRFINILKDGKKH
jgi:cysteinyl-tRNA synthetase